MSALELEYAYGRPSARGELRSAPADFRVIEDLGFGPDGVGEHVFVRLEKTGANTAWVAEGLARFCGVAPMAVSYAGMKDRNAITEQTFSVHLPGKATPAFEQLALEQVRILEVTRHSRKLNRGALKGNRFEISVRAVEGDLGALDARVAQVASQGVPNYFGEQRFGHDAGNLDEARALFGNPRKRVPRHLESIYLSAARSQIFNQVLNLRVGDGSWCGLIEGDVPMLAGTQSVFGPEPLTSLLKERAAALDIHPSGPMWGAGALRSTALAAALEQGQADRFSDLASGLAARGLKQERRSLRLGVDGLRHARLDDTTVRFDFSLPAGCYATTVLRELILT